MSADDGLPALPTSVRLGENGRGQDVFGYDADDMRDYARTAVAAALAARQPVGEAWMPIETAPKDGRTLLLGRFNSNKKWRTMRGQWMSQEHIDESWENPEGVEAGWYETVVECDDVPNCWPTEPTHWMLLPAAPGAASHAPQAAQAEQAEAPTWRCFHCDEVFATEVDAELHFGRSEYDKPACQFNVEHIRWMESQHRRNVDDDSDALRTVRSLLNEHEDLRRKAEELGYARGLADAKKHPEDLGLATQPTASNAGEREALSRARDLLCNTPLVTPSEATAILTGAEKRPCTCHPDDNPPIPCARKYALSECRAALATKPPAGEQKPVADLTGWRFVRNEDGSIGIFAPPPEPGKTQRTSGLVTRRQFDTWELLGRLADAAPAQPEQVAQDREDAERWRWVDENKVLSWSAIVGAPVYADEGGIEEFIRRAARTRGEQGGSV